MIEGVQMYTYEAMSCCMSNGHYYWYGLVFKYFKTFFVDRRQIFLVGLIYVQILHIIYIYNCIQYTISNKCQISILYIYKISLMWISLYPSILCLGFILAGIELKMNHMSLDNLLVHPLISFPAKRQ